MKQNKVSSISENDCVVGCTGVSSHQNDTYSGYKTIKSTLKVQME